ncbi:MAG: hypothetical protein NXI31_14935 [bacterium]|nr:hypothetical protein [bacterium]
MFRELDAAKIITTVERLRGRIRERFPDANLGRVADDLVELARSHAERSAAIGRPALGPRVASMALIAVALIALVLLFWSARPETGFGSWAISEIVATLETALSMAFFLGAGAVFALSLEQRSRRRRCLEALHEVRSMAHIVDMHQLTKDPDRLLRGGGKTRSSPERGLSRFELSRYLDYCSEMLALMGKLAALYGQRFPDSVALAAIDEVEDLTTSLSRKIWQKIMILGETEEAK